MLLAFAMTAWLLLAGQIHGMPQISRVIPRIPVDYSLMHHDAYVAHKHGRRAHPVFNHEAYHQRNVLPTSIVAEPSATAIALPANSPNVKAATSWDTQTEAACVKSLATMNGQASNPSGMAVCYNVRSFNSTSGAFQADLRLYRIAPPDKVWDSLKTQGVNVGLSYNGASVAPSNANKVKRDDEILSWPPIKSNKIGTLRLRRAASLPTKLQDMSFVGKVNSNVLPQMKDKYVFVLAQGEYHLLTIFTGPRPTTPSFPTLLSQVLQRTVPSSRPNCLQKMRPLSMAYSPTKLPNRPQLQHRHRRQPQVRMCLSCLANRSASFQPVSLLLLLGPFFSLCLWAMER